MKNYLFFLSSAAILSFSACKEEPIIIPDPRLNVTGRTVLVEEVTGVRCQNCPLGTQTLVALQQQYGKEKLVVVSIHAAGVFSVPYPSSAYNFSTPEIQELANYIGPLEGFPTASINRRLLTNEPSIFINPHTRWGGEVIQDLQKDPSLAVSIDNTFNPASRALGIKVGILPDQALLGDYRLTVLITQDSIVDPQLNGVTLVQNYIHRHVVRDVVSAPSGDPINEPFQLGIPINKTYNVTLPQGWEEGHCSVVAFVHRAGTPDKEVLQATEKYIIE